MMNEKFIDSNFVVFCMFVGAASGFARLLYIIIVLIRKGFET